MKLLPGSFLDRAKLNRDYVASLKDDNLLQNFYLEAGLWNPIVRMTSKSARDRGEDMHWGWESPTCQLRGHFLGHWLSAAAYIAGANSDAEIGGKLARVVSELARVQKENGGRWAASIPEKYLYWVAQKKPVWAPHYTIHKTFMGLLDAWTVTGNKQALAIAENFAPWFHEWSGRFSREQFNDILDVETGGMLEVWADLYGTTGKSLYRDLMDRYYRPRLFERLLEGKDVLTNKHANTTIPEAQGVARAYEVTGEAKWRDAALAYWKCAVTTRGAYATGGQTSGEIWTPPGRLSARLGDKNQEHCVVYNMIRLADYLFRWTGEAQYADYIERNLHNGILAQQHPQTGMVAYFLPLAAGSKKIWGTPTDDFWCCHGSLVQAHSRHDRYIYYANRDGIVVAQYIPSEAVWPSNGAPVRISQTMLREADDHRVDLEQDPESRPNHWAVEIRVDADQPAEFSLRLRLPSWLRSQASVRINNQEQPAEASSSSGFLSLKRVWRHDQVRIIFPKGLTASPLPDRPDTVAFLDGPVVLAALASGEVTLTGDPSQPGTLLVADNEREWASWLGGFRTVNQNPNLRFVPLNGITDQAYTVYCQIRPSRA
ncbi:MAG: beta-L-arabinofuranosidase domain-containing protein [Bryobacteraceae bacterium]